MAFLTLNDGTEIFYKDTGSGQPLVFSHGWPLDGDAWDAQRLFFAQQGYRVIAHDRRGHGRSGPAAQGNDMDTYADDLAQLLEALGIDHAILIGHSTGGGEVVRYLSLHGATRVAKAVLIGAVPPLLLKTDANPDGTPLAFFDQIRAEFNADRSHFLKNLAPPFFGFHHGDVNASQDVMDAFCSMGMLGSLKSQSDCIKAFSETDFTDDLKTIDIPTLILHGDEDVIVPLAASSQKSHALIKNSTLHIIKGGSHGMCVVQADEINEALLAFIES